MRINFLLFLAITSLSMCTKTSSTVWNYPSLETSPVQDSHLGLQLEDHYRVLEDMSHTKVKKWIEEERKLYNKVIHSISKRDALEKEISDLVLAANIRVSFPRIAGKKAFFVRHNVKEKTATLICLDSVGGPERSLYQINNLNVDQESSIDYYEP